MTATYYAFMFGDQKAGYQVVKEWKNGKHKKEIITKFKMNGELIQAIHTLEFGPGNTLFAFSADQSEPIRMSRYPDLKRPYPTAAYQEIINIMRLNVGESFEFTAILDGTGEVIGNKSFVVEPIVEWANPITAKSLPLKKIVEYSDGKPGRYFFVDENKMIHMAHWQGPDSVLVGSKEQVLEGLDFE